MFIASLLVCQALRACTDETEAISSEALALIPSPPELRSQVQPLDFKLLGIPAAYKPIESHWRLYDLQLWHERIYLAHGDWAANTVLVRLIYYDLVSGDFAPQA